MKTQLNLPIFDMDAIINDIKDSIDSIVPSRLDELNGKQVIFCNDRSLIPIHGWDQDATDEIIIKRIEPLSIDTCVVGIDSSCILVGETVDGFIYSAKCCIALAYSGKMVTHAKVGPMLFYVKSDYDTINAYNAQANNSVEEGKRMIRIRLERVIQYKISRLLSNSIILVDGALRASDYESCMLANIIDACNTNGNMLIGLSKSTSFKHLSRIASSLTKQMYPCYTYVTDIIKGLINNCNSNDNSKDLKDVSILLAKLNSNGLVIRVDIPSMYDVSYALGILVKNDTFHNGYPDTLRIAHHTSVFTSTDVLCLKGFMKSRLGVKEVDGDNARRLLIGKAC
jgi:hypothetical protein